MSETHNGNSEKRFALDFLTRIMVIGMVLLVLPDIKAGFYAWLKVAYLPKETQKYDLHMHYNFHNLPDIGDDPVRPDHREPIAGDSV